MNRTDFLSYLALLSAGTAFVPAAFKRWESPFTELRKGVGKFSMQGGTIGWFVADGIVVVIDSQLPDSATLFVRGIEEYGNGPEKVLFNTQQGIRDGKSLEELTQIQHFEGFPDHESPSDFLSLPRNIDVAWYELTNSE